MIFILGKTASGKTTIVKKLVNDYDYKQVITYTTRPIRKGEIPGVTYHYISIENFQQKIHDGFFAEWKVYHTVFGDWYYGSSKSDIENADSKSIIILTPDGFKDVIKNIPYFNYRSIYIYSNNQTIKNRLIKRGDNVDEANRRLCYDTIDFDGIESAVDKIFYNNEETDLDELVSDISKYLEVFS